MAASEALRLAFALAAVLVCGAARSEVVSSEGHRYDASQCAPAAFILATEENVTRTSRHNGEDWTTTSQEVLALDVECAVYDAYFRAGRWCSDESGVTVEFPGATVTFAGLAPSCPAGSTLAVSCPCLPGGDAKSNSGEKRP